MAFRKFEELPAWQAAAEVAVRILEWGDRGVFTGHAGLRDQLERAAFSISNNIAEGYERGTSAELLTFLYYARGSAGEVRSMLDVMERAPGWSNLSGDITSLVAVCFSLSRQLGAWIESVKGSDYGGNRRQTPASRNARQITERRDDYMNNLRRIVEDARDSRERPDPSTGEPE